MLKMSELEKTLEVRLRELLARVPFVATGASEVPRPFGLLGPSSPDFMLPVQIGNERRHLLCEVKAQAQPRQVRLAALELKDYLATLGDPLAYSVLLAPYISPKSAEICRQAGIGYADCAGNCYLVFGNVFIEYSGATNPQVEKRGLRSIFSPKSARIMRALLGDPGRLWRVAELAEVTGTSLGQVSNVRSALVDREWAIADKSGLKLARPVDVLDAWRDAYSKQKSIRKRYYTLLHGENLEAFIKTALIDAGQGAHALQASFSAARWLAPFARYPSQVFYADEAGEQLLRERLQLQPVSKGENVIIVILKEGGIFADRIEAAPGVWTTGLIQTYLDLTAAGERGAEAAEHLRQIRIEPMWKELN